MDVGGRATQEQLPKDEYLMGSTDLPAPVLIKSPHMAPSDANPPLQMRHLLVINSVFAAANYRRLALI